jgi:protocatechuate 3,4-dioxygenase beta subunit
MMHRRQFLGAAGAAVVLAACSGNDDDKGSASSSSGSTTTGPTGSSVPPTVGDPLTVADFDGVGTCALLPEMTAGPFPLDRQLDRRDITEGVEGHPLRLGLRVIDPDCAAVPGAAVEVWHSDATGDYSAFVDEGGGKDEAEGTTFLRGTQVADVDGIVEFATIYPGWYPGRAVHIHLRVHVDDAIVVTSQLFFDESYTARIFGEAPYAEFGLPDTTNETDAVSGDVATLPLLSLTPTTPGTLALLNLSITS